jgi:hypothetical protein
MARSALLAILSVLWASVAAWADDGGDLIQDHCLGCHSGARASGDLDAVGFLERARQDALTIHDRATWSRVVDRLRARDMPPRDEEDRPTEAMYRTMTEWAAARLPESPPASGLRRLTRDEYARCVEAIFGVQLDAERVLPPDEIGDGFDNNVDMQTMSPLLLERLLDAAELVAAQAVDGGPKGPSAWLVRLQDRQAASPPTTLHHEVMRILRDTWRRPADSADADRLLMAARRTLGPQATAPDTLRFVITAALCSPRFLFRSESVSSHDDAFERATRLAFLLWGTGPDDALLQVAAQGRLDTRDGLHATAAAMLADPRSRAMAHRFGVQWLQVDRLLEHEPDPKRFPGMDRKARLAIMQDTTTALHQAIVVNRPLADLVAGTPDQPGLALQRSVLMATSHPTRTSPVKRGKWVLEVLLDQPPPPAPPGVPSLERSSEGTKGLSVRQVMERHRSDPDCAACHRTMDGYGLALERLDAVGNPRDRDGDAEIDDSAELPDGSTIRGAEQLAAWLAQQPAVRRSFVRHLMTYALGRSLRRADQTQVDDIVARLGPTAGARDCLMQVVLSPAFSGLAETAGSHSGRIGGLP